MNYQRPGILSYIVKTSVLVLYGSFFIVQLFFNFDIENSSNNTILSHSHKNLALGHQSSALKKTNASKDRKQSIRLNKRFKPQAIATYNPFDVKVPVYYLETKSFVSHSDICIPALFLFPQSFRGPPVCCLT
jgi:hypothetical protein